ncbi:MAG TPA: class I SAM-dependent methyltransferase [Acidimicrobiales bacterium]|nr:class I SAM-dependent methyltransferase [Acidimicrobiales bacterium]
MKRSLRALAGRGVDALPPGLGRRARALAGRPGPRVIGFDALDAELDCATALMGESPERAQSLLGGFVVALPAPPPPDPFSNAYREWTWALYRCISGRESYDTTHEASPFDLERARTRPFPYESGSLKLVGRDLVARGYLLETLAKALPGVNGSAHPRVVEFGAGWGNLTADLVATGLDVTVVEFDPKFCALIAQRCTNGPGALAVHRGEMLDYATDEPFDAAVFYESFHHCADHLALLERLHRIVRPDGIVLFAAEPVQRLAYPWGPRLDGLSVWSSRTYGWLELGFDTRYFDAALARTGWRSRRVGLGARPAETDVLVASATRSGR